MIHSPYTVVVSAAMKDAVDKALASCTDGGYVIAALVGPLVDDAKNEYFTFSSSGFSEAQAAKVKAAMADATKGMEKGKDWHDSTDGEPRKMHESLGLKAMDTEGAR